MELDLDVIVAKWLNACGSCDAGLPASCSCSADDPRPALGALVEEVQRLREYVDKLVRRATLAEARWTVIERELEEERRRCAGLRDERDRLRNELGEVCEDREHYREGLRKIGQAVTKSGRKLSFEDRGWS